MEVENQQKLSKGCKQGQNDQSDSNDTYVGTYYSTDKKTKSQTRFDKPKDHNCRFCGTAHNDSQCTKYVSGIDRINRLKELKLCIRCMGKHHIKACTTVLQDCRRCRKGRHHTTLCRTYDNRHTQRNTNPECSSNTNTDEIQTNNVGHVSASINTTANRCSRSALATAKAKVLGTGKEVRLFFDQGSQKTFITRRLVETTV